ncbi:MAG: aminopeptidase [Chloroflexota bacterium]
MLQLMERIRSMLEAVQAIKRKEQVLVIADSDGASMWMGHLVMNVVNSMGAEAVLTVITSPENTGAREPPASVAAAMKSVNSIIRITDNEALGHSNARKEATAAGARWYIIHPSEADEIRRGVSVADIGLISERTQRVAQSLTQATFVRVTGTSGTNIAMSLAGREGLALDAMGAFAIIPYYGEAAIAPVEGTAEGIIVADLAIVQWKYLLREPLRLTIKAGKVVDVSGSMPDSKRLREMIATDENANNVAELGIGTSHIIPLPILGIRRDAARIGTAHIGIGRNDDIGGATWSRIHVDALIDGAAIELDNHCVLKDGALLI